METREQQKLLALVFGTGGGRLGRRARLAVAMAPLPCQLRLVVLQHAGEVLAFQTPVCLQTSSPVKHPGIHRGDP